MIGWQEQQQINDKHKTVPVKNYLRAHSLLMVNGHAMPVGLKNKVVISLVHVSTHYELSASGLLAAL